MIWSFWRASSKSIVEKLRTRQLMMGNDGQLLMIRTRDETTINWHSGSIDINIAMHSSEVVGTRLWFLESPGKVQ